MSGTAAFPGPGRQSQRGWHKGAAQEGAGRQVDGRDRHAPIRMQVTYRHRPAPRLHPHLVSQPRGALRRPGIDRTNTGSAIWADTAYRSQKNERAILRAGLVSKIHFRKAPEKPLPDPRQRANAARSPPSSMSSPPRNIGWACSYAPAAWSGRKRKSASPTSRTTSNASSTGNVGRTRHDGRHLPRGCRHRTLPIGKKYPIAPARHAQHRVDTPSLAPRPGKSGCPHDEPIPYVSGHVPLLMWEVRRGPGSTFQPISDLIAASFTMDTEKASA